MEKIIIVSDAEKIKEIRKIAAVLELGKTANFFSFGFSKDADFFASDQIETEEGISFKLNYSGNSVPIWLKNPVDENKIKNVLAALSAGILSGVSVIEMSEKLKNL